MSEENKDKPAPQEVKTPVKVNPANRKYIYKGKPRAEHHISIFGLARIRPQYMSDEEIDKLLKKHPKLARLWDVRQ